MKIKDLGWTIVGTMKAITCIMGGSAWKFVEAIKEAGIVEQKEDRNYFVVKQKITFSDEEHGVDLIVYPDDHFSVNVLIDYNSKILGNFSPFLR